MKKLFLGLLLIKAIGMAYFLGKKTAPRPAIKSSGIIKEQFKNVSKLVVSEGNFSDIITYKDVKEIYLSWLKAEKKAVVLVNAKATISYDLSKVEFETNEATQTITIIKLPEPVLQTYPKLEYYDLQADFLNEFNAEDYNKIAMLVENRLQKQIKTSTMVTNAQNRLVTEIYALLNKQGLPWKIEYNKDEPVLDFKK